MSDSDGFDEADSPDFQPAVEGPGRGVDSLLVETLIHVLVEKGVLTRNDALGVVATAAQVVQGREVVGDEGAAAVQIVADLNLLRRLFASFEALESRPGVVHVDGDNVHRLRRPYHGDRPEFPRDD